MEKKEIYSRLESIMHKAGTALEELKEVTEETEYENIQNIFELIYFIGCKAEDAQKNLDEDIDFRQEILDSAGRVW